MGRMKALAEQIEENDNELYMATMIGITLDEFHMLTYEIQSPRIDFTRTLIFDTIKSPKEILSKIKDLENGHRVTFVMCQL